jgi:hypothetical protein
LLPHERPPDTLLDDDAELDRWWESFITERTRAAAKAFGAKTQQVQGPGMAPIPVFGG